MAVGVGDDASGEPGGLLLVAVGGQSIAVAHRGLSPGGMRMDVVELADRGIAVRGPARLVAPSEQLRHPGWECTTSRFGGDELTGAPCVVQAPQCHGDGSASRAVGVMSIVGGFGALDRRQHLLPDVLVRHGAVALDGGGISVTSLHW